MKVYRIQTVEGKGPYTGLLIFPEDMDYHTSSSGHPDPYGEALDHQREWLDRYHGTWRCGFSSITQMFRWFPATAKIWTALRSHGFGLALYETSDCVVLPRQTCFLPDRFLGWQIQPRTVGPIGIPSGWELAAADSFSNYPGYGPSFDASWCESLFKTMRCCDPARIPASKWVLEP